MKYLKSQNQLNESNDLNGILKNILKEVKKKSKSKYYMGADVHDSAFREGKELVIEILEETLKKYDK